LKRAIGVVPYRCKSCGWRGFVRRKRRAERPKTNLYLIAFIIACGVAAYLSMPHILAISQPRENISSVP
jgi:hypothetical protein